MTKELYILSGLGVDERVFQKIDFTGFIVIFIKWIAPEANETIEDYASRLLDQIKAPKPTLIGLSFGGMIAIEIAKRIKTEKVILIASAKTKKEIPLYYRFAGLLRFHRLIPSRILKKAGFITNWFFDTSSTEDKQLLKQILMDTDAGFLKWAIGKIVLWQNTTLPENVIHIHGTKDRILPLFFIKSNLNIEKGGHLMTLNKADELNAAIKGFLK